MNSNDVLNGGYALLCAGGAALLFACAFWIAKAAWKNNGNTDW
jgi:hypothetical protein